MRLYDELVARIEERDAKNGTERRMLVDSEIDGIYERSRSKKTGRIYCVIGGGSIWSPAEKVKYLRQEVYPISPAEVAREYLRYIGAEKKAVKATPSGFRVDAPLYYNKEIGTRGGDWAYVDLESCYWSIYHRSTWNVAYGRGIFGSYILPGEVDFTRCDEWRQHKIARNSIWGLMIAKRMVVMTDSGLVQRNFRGDFYNPSLATWIMDVLHSIAHDMIEFSRSPLWYTDGFCVKPDQVEDVVHRLKTVWGMESSVKEIGSGRILGLGNYEWRKSFDSRTTMQDSSNLGEPQVTPEQWLAHSSLHRCNCG